MAKIRFAIVGSGWRSLFYVRLAKRYPDLFDLVGLLCRSEEKALSISGEYSIRTFLNERDVLALKPDFLVVAVNKASIAQVSLHFMREGVPVVCETPAALTEEDLDQIWREHGNGGRILVSEQYPYLPEMKEISKALNDGMIGERSSLYLSRAHEYHAFSLMRAFLGVNSSEAFSVRAVTQTSYVARTRDRYHTYEDGALKSSSRTSAYIAFDNGKTCLYDFEGEEYHSAIRGYSIRIGGERGEFRDGTFTFLDENNQVKKLYTSSRSSGIAEDEEAIRAVLEKASFLFSEKKAGKEEKGLLSCALQDSYSAILLRQAAETGQIIKTQIKGWNNI